MTNFEKNTGTRHPGVERMKKRATGTVPLTDDFGGVLWHGSIQVGTPASTFTGMVFHSLNYY